MKERIFISGMVFIFLVALSAGCAKSMESDAHELAAIQLQKNKEIRSLLVCNDSSKKVIMMEQIRILEVHFDSQHARYQKKYKSPETWDDFEKAFIRHLKNPKRNQLKQDSR